MLTLSKVEAVAKKQLVPKTKPHKLIKVRKLIQAACQHPDPNKS